MFKQHSIYSPLQKMIRDAINRSNFIKIFKLSNLDNIEIERKQILVYIFLTLGALATIIFAFFNYYNHEYSVIIVDSFILLSCIFLLSLMRWKDFFNFIVYTVVILFFISIMALTLISQTNQHYLTTMLLTPAVYIFLLGGKVGALLSFFHPVVLCILYIFFKSYYNFTEDFFARIILIDFIIIILVSIYEHTRFTVQNALTVHKTLLDKNITKLDRQQREYIKIMQNVTDGIFLLNDRLQIKFPYSHALKKILKVSFIPEGEAFIKILEGKVFASKLIQLEHYLQELLRAGQELSYFHNPLHRITIRQNIPHKSNAQLTPSENSTFKQTIVTFSFTTIHHNKNSVEILGQVVDISSEISLQKRLKKQKELEVQKQESIIQLTHLNPTDLSELIRHSHEKLLAMEKESKRYLSHSYELEDPKKIEKLRSFLLSELHTIKGNASVTGFTSLATWIHQCESRIDRLSTKPYKIQLNEFRRILTETQNEIKATEDLIDKLGEFNHRYKESTQQTPENIEKFLRKAISRSRHTEHPPITLDTKNFEEHLFDPSNQNKNQLKDILVVFVKNSLSHGIESAKERQTLKKPPTAVITLSSYKLEGQRVALTYRDDGKGLDEAKIKEQLLKKVKLSPTETKLSSHSLQDAVLSQHFSTKQTLSLDAGRGIGLYSVKKIMLSLGGEIQIKSFPGQGLMLTLIFPVNHPIPSQNNTLTTSIPHSPKPLHRLSSHK